MNFFYDNQTRRYLLQFMRVFSDIKVRNGPDAAGNYTLSRVPVMYGDPSYIVAQLIKGASENTTMPSPLFSVYVDSIKLAADRRRDTQHVSTISTVERNFDAETQTYGNKPGIRYDVDRYMPVPYDFYFKLDCWTTNTTNKLQIFEQIAPIFNPSIQLQQNSNLLDWTSIFGVWFEDFVWTSRSIPQGTEIQRDVMSWKFKVPGWINPPAKVKKSTLVAEIVSNVFNDVDIKAVETNFENNEYDIFRTCFNDTPSQIITTDGNYKISVDHVNGQDEITLLNANGNVDPTAYWENVFVAYGQITPNITKIRLKLNPNIDIVEDDIIGGIVADPVRPNVLIFTPDNDTLPVTTIPAIDAIIDPTEVTPGNGLPLSVAGQRYLLTSAQSTGEETAIPAGVNNSPWGPSLVAYPNDIIGFNGIKWIVIFDSRNSTGLNYVFNNSDEAQYTYNGTNWYHTYLGEYGPGYWRIDGIINTPAGTINNYL